MNHRMLKRMRLSPRQRRAVFAIGKLEAELRALTSMRCKQRRELAVMPGYGVHFDNCSFPRTKEVRR